MAAKKKPKKREPTVMMSVRMPPDLEERARIAAGSMKMTLQAYVQMSIRCMLGDL